MAGANGTDAGTTKAIEATKKQALIFVKKDVRNSSFAFQLNSDFLQCNLMAKLARLFNEVFNK
jgi:hypothetical protein